MARTASSETPEAQPARAASRRGPSKGDLREAAILDAVTRLLEDKSFTEISVEEIAAAAGISRSSFYFYFPSKDALLHALDERLGREALERNERDLPLPEAIKRSIEYSFRSWRSQGAVYRAIVSSMGSDRELAELWDSHVNQMVARAAERIRRERRDGRARPGPPSAHALASALTTLNEQALLAQAARRPFAIDDSELVRTLTTIWLRAIYGTDSPS